MSSYKQFYVLYFLSIFFNMGFNRYYALPTLVVRLILFHAYQIYIVSVFHDQWSLITWRNTKFIRYDHLVMSIWYVADVERSYAHNKLIKSDKFSITPGKWDTVDRGKQILYRFGTQHYWRYQIGFWPQDIQT